MIGFENKNKNEYPTFIEEGRDINITKDKIENNPIDNLSDIPEDQVVAEVKPRYPVRGRVNRTTAVVNRDSIERTEKKKTNLNADKSKSPVGVRNVSKNNKFNNPYVKSKISAPLTPSEPKVREKFSRNKINKNFLDKQGDVIVEAAPARNKSNNESPKATRKIKPPAIVVDEDGFDPSIEVKIPKSPVPQFTMMDQMDKVNVLANKNGEENPYKEADVRNPDKIKSMDQDDNLNEDQKQATFGIEIYEGPKNNSRKKWDDTQSNEDYGGRDGTHEEDNLDEE